MALKPQKATLEHLCTSVGSSLSFIGVAPQLNRQFEDAGQREHSLREVFNGLRYIVKTGAPWRWMPNAPSHGQSNSAGSSRMTNNMRKHSQDHMSSFSPAS